MQAAPHQQLVPSIEMHHHRCVVAAIGRHMVIGAVLVGPPCDDGGLVGRVYRLHTLESIWRRAQDGAMVAVPAAVGRDRLVPREAEEDLLVAAQKC